MRHLGSIVLSLILAPLIYLLIGVGAANAATAMLSANLAPDYGKAGGALLALLVAALLYTLLVLTPISPAGPLLAGVAFLAVSVWVLFDTLSFVRLVLLKIQHLPGSAGITPAGPYLLLLAVPLLVTALAPRRWQSEGSASAPARTPRAYPPPPGYQPIFTPPPAYRPSRAAIDADSQPVDPTRSLYPPPLTPPVMQPPVSPAPAPPPVDPGGPTQRFGA